MYTYVGVLEVLVGERHLAPQPSIGEAAFLIVRVEGVEQRAARDRATRDCNARHRE